MDFGPFRKFRVTAVRLSLAITAVAALIAYRFSAVAAQGVLLGGIAGVLGFWIIAIRLQKFALNPRQDVKFAVLTLTAWRFALYGAVLVRAYWIDRESFHGLLGAVGGIVIIRFVLIFLGITGIDMPRPNSEADRDPD